MHAADKGVIAAQVHRVFWLKLAGVENDSREDTAAQSSEQQLLQAPWGP